MWIGLVFAFLGVFGTICSFATVQRAFNASFNSPESSENRASKICI